MIVIHNKPFIKKKKKLPKIIFLTYPFLMFLNRFGIFKNIGMRE